MKKIIPILAAASVLLTIGMAKSADNNASLSLQKDKGTGLFILNMRDSQGIRSFSLVFPTDKLPYGGDLSGCPPSKTIDNITISDPADFKPLMNAVILDCQGNETEFEISAPAGGIASVKKISIEPPPPAPTPEPQAAQEEASGASGGAGGTSAATEGSAAGSSSLAEIQYPIPALGNCKSKESCKDYCESPANLDKCLAFAEKNGLLKNEEIEHGKKFSEIIKSGGGPGGCKTEKSCFEYCNNVDQINECVAFAEKNGFMDQKELDEAKKIQSIVKSGKNLPGNCKNRSSCEAYCKNPEHFDECVAFAKEAGFMSAEEIKEAEKMMPLIKSGQTPGKCKSKEECEAFCAVEENFEECVNFAQKAGLVSEKELEMMKKTGGKGPGGCRGKACQTFCENPANQKTCFEFAKEHGLMSDDDIKRMEEGKKMLREQLENGPPEIKECLKSVVDINSLETDGFAGGQELGEKMRECFEKMAPSGSGGLGEDGEFRGGPGGCKSREECEAYCESNPSECGAQMPGTDKNMMPRPDGTGTPGSETGVSGPGGCKSKEECEEYCKTNPEACAASMPASRTCPAMPTVETCPDGQKKMEVFNSPECGAYYSCVPESAPALPAGSDTGQTPAEPYNQIYQQQFQGPGGCKTPEECQTYCAQNPQDQACAHITPQSSSLPVQSPFATILLPILNLLQ